MCIRDRRAVPLSAPSMRIVSTVTGTWLTDAQATDPHYWARHLREPVRFSPAVRTAMAELSGAVFVEAGPRGTLSTLVRQHRGSAGVPLAVASLADDASLEPHTLTEAAGQLWALGAGLPWPASPATGRRRIVLPSYAFERQRHWVDAAPLAVAPSPPAAPKMPVMAAAPADMAPAAIAADTALIPVHPLAEITMTTPAPANRRPMLVQRLRGVFEDVSGIELADADAAASFVELGLDSLTLTQAALQLKKVFAVPVSFRQLMESYRSFDALSAFLDEKLPAETVPIVPAVVAAQVAPAAAQVVGAPLAAAALPCLL
jgi:acyl transferase domain-containing protein